MKKSVFVRTLSARSLVILTLIALFVTAAHAQTRAMEPVEADSTNAVSLTLHKRQSDGSFSAALDLTDPNTKLFTGDRVRLNYRAPFASYVYIVNFSNSGGTALVYPRRPEQNSAIPANTERSFLLDLTNRQGVQGQVTEEAIVIVTRQPVNNPTLSDLLRNYSRARRVDEKFKGCRGRGPRSNRAGEEGVEGSSREDRAAEVAAE